MTNPYDPDSLDLDSLDLDLPPLTPRERNQRRPRETDARLLERIRNDKYDTRPFHIRIGEAWGFPVESDHAAQMIIENKNPDGTPFDGVAALEKMRREDPWMFTPHKKAHKLTHDGHCQAYAALYVGTPQYVVAKAFDLSAATVSHLAGCRQDRREPVTTSIDDGTRVHTELHQTHNLTRGRNMNRKVHYAAVEEEFETLGEAEFIRRYYTPWVQSRIKWAKSQIKTRVWLD